MKVFRIRTTDWSFYAAAPRQEVGSGMLISHGLIDEDEARHIEEITDVEAHFFVRCRHGANTPHIEFGNGFCARPLSLVEQADALSQPDLLAIGPIDCRP